VSDDRITATYLIETAHPLQKAAEAMAGEQSSGTFVPVPGETDELRARHGAAVTRITEFETVDSPSLPGSHPPKGSSGPLRYKRAEVVLSFPLENVGPSLPNLMSMVAGNLFELGQFSGLKLIDLQLPPAFAQAHPGPQFGIEGTRQLSGVYDRPLIGTIIKPSVGLSPQETAGLIGTLAGAGLDFVKDDELIANPPYSPLKERVKAVMRVVNDQADRSGKKVMVAFNITDEIEAMYRHHDLVHEAGGTCIMVSLLSVGMAGVAALRKHSQLPIHAHRNGWGIYNREPYLGISYVAYQKFWRLIGVDHMHVNGLRNKFCEPDESVIASARECLTPMFEGDNAKRGFCVMPVFSSGQWAGQAPDTYKALGSVDLMYLAGGGVMAHPAGPAAGATSLRQAWEAAAQGVPLAEYARSHPELRQAMEKYGSNE
jgi:ribulose-bisphosphate carboxylase large chain